MGCFSGADTPGKGNLLPKLIPDQGIDFQLYDDTETRKSIFKISSMKPPISSLFIPKK
jgi:hypothetical protein